MTELEKLALLAMLSEEEEEQPEEEINEELLKEALLKEALKMPSFLKGLLKGKSKSTGIKALLEKALKETKGVGEKALKGAKEVGESDIKLWQALLGTLGAGGAGFGLSKLTSLQKEALLKEAKEQMFWELAGERLRQKVASRLGTE